MSDRDCAECGELGGLLELIINKGTGAGLWLQRLEKLLGEVSPAQSAALDRARRCVAELVAEARRHPLAASAGGPQVKSVSIRRPIIVFELNKG